VYEKNYWVGLGVNSKIVTKKAVIYLRKTAIYHRSSMVPVRVFGKMVVLLLTFQIRVLLLAVKIYV
jgi:hypothetical protein